MSLTKKLVPIAAAGMLSSSPGIAQAVEPASIVEAVDADEYLSWTRYGLGFMDRDLETPELEVDLTTKDPVSRRIENIVDILENVRFRPPEKAYFKGFVVAGYDAGTNVRVNARLFEQIPSGDGSTKVITHVLGTGDPLSPSERFELFVPVDLEVFPDKTYELAFGLHDQGLFNGRGPDGAGLNGFSVTVQRVSLDHRERFIKGAPTITLTNADDAIPAEGYRGFTAPAFDPVKGVMMPTQLIFEPIKPPAPSQNYPGANLIHQVVDSINGVAPEYLKLDSKMLLSLITPEEVSSGALGRSAPLVQGLFSIDFALSTARAEGKDTSVIRSDIERIRARENPGCVSRVPRTNMGFVQLPVDLGRVFRPGDGKAYIDAFEVEASRYQRFKFEERERVGNERAGLIMCI
jgi:hypothetical protein